MIDAPATATELEAPAAAASSRRTPLGYALVLSAVGLWSLNATVSKIVLDSGGLTPLRLAELRAAGAAAVLVAAVALLAPRAHLRPRARHARSFRDRRPSSGWSCRSCSW